MQLRCIKCKEVKYPSIDDVKAVAEMIERNNLDATMFLDALTPIGGKCNDGNRHIFDFDETFANEIHDLAENYARLDTEITGERESCNNLLKERKELEEKLLLVIKNVEEKFENIKLLDADIKNIKDKCENLTGTCNIKLWSIEK